jgi:hypothetical protein
VDLSGCAGLTSAAPLLEGCIALQALRVRGAPSLREVFRPAGPAAPSLRHLDIALCPAELLDATVGAILSGQAPNLQTLVVTCPRDDLSALRHRLPGSLQVSSLDCQV